VELITSGPLGRRRRRRVGELRRCFFDVVVEPVEQRVEGLPVVLGPVVEYLGQPLVPLLAVLLEDPESFGGRCEQAGAAVFGVGQPLDQPVLSELDCLLMVEISEWRNSASLLVR
jgi:hypothetical protein